MISNHAVAGSSPANGATSRFEDRLVAEMQLSPPRVAITARIDTLLAAF